MYDVLLERHAERALRKLPRPLADRVIQAIRALSTSPRPPGCRKLVGGEGEWRIRVGEYRVIYEIDDHARHVRIMLIRHRREAYR